ncbi:MAG TPA: 2-oxoglutarate and iron-dependent oxygenase domain-containing protein [Blastocatellia bacterium]|nr:2-oxoglutarate and iron-dependent oxygenase domain-containing protein [Blastocatellia bacterium]
MPIIDVAPLVSGEGDRHTVAAQVGRACRDYGFFYIVGHGVDGELQLRLENLSRQFFARSLESKLEIRMSRGGKAWRGYFPVGGELTSGRPDLKEGLYFGAELEDDHPMVKAGTPMHGRNLFPSDLPLFRRAVLDYISAMTGLGHALMSAIALSLGLEESYFADRYMSDPLVLFRVFNYPPSPEAAGRDESWGVGEHTDYGVLTILRQDESGGLEVKSRSRWIAAPPVAGSFVCNIGDMLDRITRGLYRSTPHRAQNPSGRNRLSFPFFFDPNFDAEVTSIRPGGPVPANDDRDQRWDRASVHDFGGTYGDYLLGKVSKVFPELRRSVL